MGAGAVWFPALTSKGSPFPGVFLRDFLPRGPPFVEPGANLGAKLILKNAAANARDNTGPAWLRREEEIS